MRWKRQKGEAISKLLTALMLSVLVFMISTHMKPAPVESINNSGVRKARTTAAKPIEAPKAEPQVELATKVETKAAEPAPVPVPTPAPVVVERPVAGTPQDWMTQAGINPNEWAAVDYIVTRESGWCPHKWEGDIGVCLDYYREKYSPYDTWKGYGLCQSTPAIKMATNGTDWADDPVTQLSWCNAYANARYGGWWGAYNHWINFHNW